MGITIDLAIIVNNAKAKADADWQELKARLSAEEMEEYCRRVSEWLVWSLNEANSMCGVSDKKDDLDK